MTREGNLTITDPSRTTMIDQGYRDAQPDEISETQPFSQTNIGWTSYMNRMAVKQAQKEYKKPEEKMMMDKQSDNKKQPKEPEKMKEKLEKLRKHWLEEYNNIMNGPPNRLPLMREVNHEINLIDEGKRYGYHSPCCPDSMKGQFHEKLNRYINAGWWQAKPINQAAPLLCVAKKDGKLRTVIDARKRNDNTVKDITPLPDQETI